MKYSEGIKKLLTLTGWRQFFKVLNKKEKNIFFVFLSLTLGSFIFLSVNFYCKNTEVVPAEGGIYIEGLLESPRLINPIYGVLSDTDRDLTQLLFLGLVKYTPDGKIVPDLAESYEILENGKVYEFYLKENLLWSDGKPLTIDDVIFTIKTVQNPDFKSPLRASWLGVKVEKISDLGIRFQLQNPSAVFLENCTLKILPKHIWQDVSSQNFPLSIYNLKPIGSGPYKIKNLIQEKEGKILSLELVRNPNYTGSQPNIPQIVFYFFDNEDDLIKAFNSKKIKGFSLLSLNRYQDLTNKNFSEYRLSLPRYFAVFFNLNPPTDGTKILTEKGVRLALNYGTNKEEIVNKILLNQGKVVNSAILPEIYGFDSPTKIYQFNQKEAEKILEGAGFLKKDNGIREKIVKKSPAFQLKSNLRLGSQGKEVEELQKCLAKYPEIYPEGEVTGYFGEKTKTAVIKFQEKYREEILIPAGLEKGNGEVKKLTRDKLNELCFAKSEEKITLKFSLITVNQPMLIEIANLLKSQWRTLGVEVDIKTFDIGTLEREIIKPRNYEALLFGEVLGAIPDPFPFWHSSQKKDPGLNLTGYENKKCDKLLEEARTTLNEKEIKEKLENFQNLLIDDAPVIFLYNPDYPYLISKEIKGINTKIIVDPSKRFSNIENWYIETKRVWK